MSRLGELLVRRGQIAADHLHKAIDEQRTHGGALASHLVKLGFINEDALLSYLQKEYRLPVVDPSTREWAELRSAIAAAVASRTRDEWCRIMEGTDACFAPVLTVEEAARHPHNVARGSVVNVNGVEQNAPAPRFSRTPSHTPEAPRRAGEDTDAVLTEAGFTRQQIEDLRSSGALT